MMHMQNTDAASIHRSDSRHSPDTAPLPDCVRELIEAPPRIVDYE
jgi:hypothetical protein